MANTKKIQEEDLKKLEDEAYFELCQIIAEAMELQDVDLLNSRIASWKSKYKKLLDRPSTNSKSSFKKRIEFLLTQYYSEVTKYILNQLKLKEEKKVENQAKALRELYTIIRDTNDYELLKKKVKKWEDKYPTSAFFKMYQKRIQSYTRDKNLKENSFNQEEAFNDLVAITKVHGTLDELKSELTLWEEKYSINNKYTIDDFLKHQTEVKRYTSDEFLQSIAREEFKQDNVNKSKIDIVAEYNNNSFSSLSIQASAYASLLKISKSPNAVDEMFAWVYKNSNVKFNDKYKELILSATYLNYSPSYLNKISKPEINISKKSLSLDEYTNIDEIKRYAIISYFNLLLPPEKAIANDSFNKNIQAIYAKSEKARVSNLKPEPISIDALTSSGLEIPLGNQSEETVIFSVPENNFEIEKSLGHETETEESFDIDNTMEAENIVEQKIEADFPDVEQESTVIHTLEKNANDDSKIVNSDVSSNIELIENPEPLDHSTIVAISPLFFEALNNYNNQSVLINHIDNTTTKFIETEKEIQLDEQSKTKYDLD